MIAGHIIAGHHDVAVSVTPNAQSAGWYRVFTPVDERNQATAEHASAAAGCHRGRCCRRAERRHHDCAACLTVIGEAELTPGHLDPVSVEQRRRLSTERHTIHQYRGPRRHSPHSDGASRVHDDDRKSPLLWTSIEPHLRLVACPDSQLANAQLDLFVVKPNVSHAGSGSDPMREAEGDMESPLRRHRLHGSRAETMADPHGWQALKRLPGLVPDSPLHAWAAAAISPCWRRYSRWYNPPRARSSRWVPRSRTSP